MVVAALALALATTAMMGLAAEGRGATSGAGMGAASGGDLLAGIGDEVSVAGSAASTGSGLAGGSSVEVDDAGAGNAAPGAGSAGSVELSTCLAAFSGLSGIALGSTGGWAALAATSGACRSSIFSCSAVIVWNGISDRGSEAGEAFATVEASQALSRYASSANSLPADTVGRMSACNTMERIVITRLIFPAR